MFNSNLSARATFYLDKEALDETCLQLKSAPNEFDPLMRVRLSPAKKTLPTALSIQETFTKKSQIISVEYAANLRRLAQGLQDKYSSKPHQIESKLENLNSGITIRTKSAITTMAGEICQSIKNEMYKISLMNFDMFTISEANAKGEEFTALQMHLNNSCQGFEATVSALNEAGASNTFFRKILAPYLSLEQYSPPQSSSKVETSSEAETSSNSARPTSYWKAIKDHVSNMFKRR